MNKATTNEATTQNPVVVFTRSWDRDERAIARDAGRRCVAKLGKALERLGQ